MVCATYRKRGKEVCSSHQIRNSVIEEFLLDGIRNVTAYVREHEEEFVEMVTKLSKAETEKTLRDEKRKLEQAESRVHKLDTIIQRLYEDNVEGKISDERFAKMSESYEAEQKTLDACTRFAVDCAHAPGTALHRSRHRIPCRTKPAFHPMV